MPREARTIDWDSTIKLFVLFAALTLLWRTPVVSALKIFVVMLHELSHAFATIVTGGSVLRIEVSPNIGGVCYSSGGNRFAILTAGYLGSMVWGSLIMLLATRLERARVMSLILGLVLGVLALVYVRTAFAFGFAAVFTLGLIAAGWKLDNDWNRLILQAIGGTCILYAPLDIFSDVIARSGIGSDAEALASLTGIPSVLWGLIWIALSLIVACAALYLALYRQPKPSKLSALSRQRRHAK